MPIDKAKEVLKIEQRSISALIRRIDRNFIKIIDVLRNIKGR